MNERNAPPLLTYRTGGRNWLQRAALTALGLAVIVLAFFFLTVALVAGALLAAVIAVRFWWIMRKVRAAQKASAPLEGEYTVTDRAELREPRR